MKSFLSKSWIIRSLVALKKIIYFLLNGFEAFTANFTLTAKVFGPIAEKKYVSFMSCQQVYDSAANDDVGRHIQGAANDNSYDSSYYNWSFFFTVICQYVYVKMRAYVCKIMIQNCATIQTRMTLHYWLLSIISVQIELKRKSWEEKEKRTKKKEEAIHNQ